MEITKPLNYPHDVAVLNVIGIILYRLKDTLYSPKYF